MGWVNCFVTWLMNKASALLSFFSAEWLLETHPNGGTVILIRSLLISIQIFLVGLLIHEATNTARSFSFSFDAVQFQTLVHDHIVWLGGILALCYTALYTRFSSQWSYLAGLYNQIMASQLGANENSDDKVYAVWISGFIEDAFMLHLATKEQFAECIDSMFKIKGVERAIISSKGEKALAQMKSKISRARSNNA